MVGISVRVDGFLLELLFVFLRRVHLFHRLGPTRPRHDSHLCRRIAVYIEHDYERDIRHSDGYRNNRPAQKEGQRHGVSERRRAGWFTGCLWCGGILDVVSSGGSGVWRLWSCHGLQHAPEAASGAPKENGSAALHANMIGLIDRLIERAVGGLPAWGMSVFGVIKKMTYCMTTILFVCTTIQQSPKARASANQCVVPRERSLDCFSRKKVVCTSR